MKWKKEVGKKAFDYHDAGFHCAEAVSKAVVETYGQGMRSEPSTSESETRIKS